MSCWSALYNRRYRWLDGRGVRDSTSSCCDEVGNAGDRAATKIRDYLGRNTFISIDAETEEILRSN
jgi:hypothetical protein